jgi:uncharacterized protein (DUF433 family)
MGKEYVEKRDGGYYIAGTRVSLDSIVYEYLKGNSPETLQEAFPSVNMEQIHGSLAFYLANRELIDDYLEQGERELEKIRLAAREKNPRLYQKLAIARKAAQMQKEK